MRSEKVMSVSTERSKHTKVWGPRSSWNQAGRARKGPKGQQDRSPEKPKPTSINEDVATNAKRAESGNGLRTEESGPLFQTGRPGETELALSIGASHSIECRCYGKHRGLLKKLKISRMP